MGCDGAQQHVRAACWRMTTRRPCDTPLILCFYDSILAVDRERDGWWGSEHEGTKEQGTFPFRPGIARRRVDSWPYHTHIAARNRSEVFNISSGSWGCFCQDQINAVLDSARINMRRSEHRSIPRHRSN
ncbi:hypothetical protein BRADI_3g54717v3 [Brachypodium distachyon]|uniref:Uncharacterized protein n=1 Tax=Brachypodium distachyon TaxID=15368 RepID=A0A2K2D543_BRADI|nr:hypothetical protein BRADI_3g54717v3 [Brachypodium distachyon]